MESCCLTYVGFWADERVDGQLWRANGLLYKTAKRCERWFFAEADAVVTLTWASVPQIRSWLGCRDVPIEVIPTCVEVDRFDQRPVRPGGPHVVWSGSVTTWYRFDLVSRVAAAIGWPLTVLTRQPDVAQARRAVAGYPAVVRSVSPEQIPDHLYAGDIGLCLITSSFSNLASAPTRFAEYLAAGMPVLVTTGVGDLEALVEDHGVGAVLRGEGAEALAQAAESLLELRDDPALSARCRTVARERFDVDAGSSAYAELYRRQPR